jgi:telomerase reverse transcriptase
VAFLWAVCRRVIPVELLGSKANWRQLRKNIYDFVHLRRYECCTLQQCMFKLKLSGYLWCQGKSFAGCKTIFTSAAEGKFTEK